MNLETTLSRYKDVYERILPSIISGFSKQNISKSHGKLNPPLWILWHMARSEDFGINRLGNDGAQEFSKNKWKSRLNISTDKIGTGMSKPEVSEICRVLNLEQLENYSKAVYKNNLATISSIQSEDLSTIWGDAYLNKVLFEEGNFDPSATGLLPVYQGKTRGWFLLHTMVAHNFYHIGQLSIIKQLLS